MAYMRLIWIYYESEQPLPDNKRMLSFKVGADEPTIELILESFFRLEGDGWHQKRCDEEIAEYRAICERNKTNGKAGGRPKKTQSVSTGLPDATQPEPIRNPNQYPVTSNQEIQKKPRKSAPIPIDHPIDVDQQVWEDWVRLRKAKNAPVSLTVVNGARSEARKAAMSLEDFLRVWCTRGSQGLEASWLKSHERPSQQSFRERDSEIGRKRWEEMTGQVHPENLSSHVLNIFQSDTLELVHEQSH
jgi:uncharacterized protein YdaU (DUF1376 family)